MSDILAKVRSLAVVAVLVLTGCGSGHDKPKPADWRAGADAACFKARNLLTHSVVESLDPIAGTVTLAHHNENQAFTISTDSLSMLYSQGRISMAGSTRWHSWATIETARVQFLAHSRISSSLLAWPALHSL